jgi:hypothetical protein
MPDEFAPRAASVTQGDRAVATQAQQMINTFRAENPTEFAEAVREFDGQAANLAVFGFGRMNVRIAGGQVSVQPGLATGDMARGAIYLEALQAIRQGVLTPLQAYFRGDIVVNAPAEDLHRAYGFFVKFAELALASEPMRDHLNTFDNNFR